MLERTDLYRSGGNQIERILSAMCIYGAVYPCGACGITPEIIVDYLAEALARTRLAGGSSATDEDPTEGTKGQGRASCSAKSTEWS
eukprot:scaffold41603_cov17-Prasinocladus_malaysianus.AAC.1